MENITRQVFEDKLPHGAGTSAGAYVIEHEKTGKLYIGSSAGIGQRQRAHLSDLKRGIARNSALQEAYNEDPNLKFTFVLTETKEEALQYEQKLLDHHQGDPRLMNVATNARAAGLGLRRSEETRHRLSEAGKGREPWNKGQPLSAKHRAHVIESREKIARKVSIAGTEYPSLTEAAQALGVTPSCIHKRIGSSTETFKDYSYVK